MCGLQLFQIIDLSGYQKHNYFLFDITKWVCCKHSIINMFLHFRVSVVLNDTMQGLDINMSCEEEFRVELCTYEEDYEELDISM